MLIFNATAGQQVFVNVTNNTFSSGSTRLEGARRRYRPGVASGCAALKRFRNRQGRTTGKARSAVSERSTICTATTPPRVAWQRERQW
jgi:hypothetical protein